MSARGLPRLRSKGGSAEESFDYALNMQFSSCTEEAIEKLHETCTKLRQDLEELEGTTIAQLWLRELDALLLAHEEYFKQRADRSARDVEPMTTSPKEKAPRRAAASKRAPVAPRRVR